MGICAYLSSLVHRNSGYTKPMITFLQSAEGLSVRINTQRLILQSITPKDIDAYAKLWSDKKVVRLYASGQPQSRDDVANRINNTWVKRWQNNDPYSGLAIFTKKGKFLGHAIVGYGDRPGQSEAAMLLHIHAWKKGYGMEIATGLKAYALAMVYLGYRLEGKPLEEVVATARVDNKATIKILEKIGMQRVGTSEKWGVKRYHYSIKPSFSQGSGKSAMAGGQAPQGGAKMRDFGISQTHSLFVRATDRVADFLRTSTHRMFRAFS